jgi:hypothetical protein
MSDAEFTHPSIAEITEDKLVERLFADPLWGTEFFELAGMPRGMLNKLRVPLHSAARWIQGRHRRSIALLARFPEQAVAYQVKRIKFGMDQVRNGTPTKLRQYIKVAQQANLVARMGFWQLYAYVVVVVDAREQNAGKNTYAGLSSKLKSLVYSAVSTQPLDQRVGLVILDFTHLGRWSLLRNGFPPLPANSVFCTLDGTLFCAAPSAPTEDCL